MSVAVATRSGSRKQTEASEYDIRVLAFSGARQQTVQGLRDLFGIDVASAQRLIASAPCVIRHKVPAAEAEYCAQVLRSFDARVLLEPLAEPPPTRSPADLARSYGGISLPPAPPTPSDRQRHDQGHELELGASRTTGQGNRDARTNTRAAPAGRARVDDSAEADLEYDMLDALEAKLDEPEGSDELRDLGRELGLTGDSYTPEAEREPHSTSLRTQQGEFDLAAAEPEPQGLELDRAAMKRTTLHGQSTGPRVSLSAKRGMAEPPGAPQTPARSPVTSMRELPGMREPTGAHKASAAALREAPKTEKSRARDVPLLQVFGALVVAAIGHWLDSSVIYGNASTISVIAHGLALQQLILGVRGLLQ
ncbi:MAG: hypothetical protein RL701_7952 [Pseudomonadota bacterium]|jgi:hypothetical protein